MESPPTPTYSKKYWTTQEETLLIKNYNELDGNLAEIARRHDRSIRAIDMRITKFIQDRKKNQQSASDVAQMFGGKMSAHEFQERWNSPSMDNRKQGTPVESNECGSLVLKYLTNMDEKLDELAKHIHKIEKMVIRLSKASKTKKGNS